MAHKPTTTPFNDIETKLICSMIRNLTGPLQIDWNAAAADTDYASGASAQRQWQKLRAKHGLGSAEGKGQGGATSVRKRKKSDEHGEGQRLPNGVKKAKGGQNGKKANGSAGSSDDGEEPKVKPEESDEIAV